MFSFILIALLVAGVVIFLTIQSKGKPSRKGKFPVPGKIIYADQGRSSKAFFNSEFKIRAKPDFLVKQSNGELVVVEYKSRQKPVNQSDEAQLIATAIAIRGKYPLLQRGYIYTRTSHKWVDLSGSSEMLAAKIDQPLTAARAVKMGESVSATPVERKCRACFFKNSCSMTKG